ncbi:hypothetical protein [Algoriphagus boritolerans]|uniref:hypothetical protein n=1 Tax=Algoriphagus boritolerans TaxID=308111 RepID=UPI000CDF2687
MLAQIVGLEEDVDASAMDRSRTARNQVPNETELRFVGTRTAAENSRKNGKSQRIKSPVPIGPSGEKQDNGKSNWKSRPRMIQPFFVCCFYSSFWFDPKGPILIAIGTPTAQV